MCGECVHVSVYTIQAGIALSLEEATLENGFNLQQRIYVITEHC